MASKEYSGDGLKGEGGYRGKGRSEEKLGFLLHLYEMVLIKAGQHRAAQNQAGTMAGLAT